MYTLKKEFSTYNIPILMNERVLPPISPPYTKNINKRDLYI